MKPLVVVFSLGVGAWTVACDSGSNVASTSNSAGTAAEFADQYCQILEPCCADAGLSTSGNYCFNQIVNQVVGTALDGQYNPVVGQECLSATLAASKNSAFCSDFGGLLSLPQCYHILGGQAVAPGESCMQSFECTTAAGGSALCFMQTSGGGSSTGTCVQTQTGAAGQGPCVATVVQGVSTSIQSSGPPPSTGYTCDVADGVSCSPTTHKCTALAATGHACQAGQDCVTSDYCASGSCQPRVAVGAACGNTSGECVNTAYCDFFSSSVCKPLLPNGSACTDLSMCKSSNCDNGKCASVSAVPLAMTCGT
jgi:hypothetical protein